MTRNVSSPIAVAAAVRNGAGPDTLTSLTSPRGAGVGPAVMVYATRESATFGYITTASTSTIVQTVSRCIVARSWAIGTASTVCARLAANARRASRSAPAGVVRSPTPTAITPGASKQHVAAFDVLEAGLVEQRRAGEPRVVAVDRLRERGLAGPCRHGEAGDRGLVTDPQAGVAGEQQVWQRIDDEVVRVHHPVDEPAAGAQLVVGDARDECRTETGRVEAREVVRDASPQAVAEAYVGEDGLGQLLASGLDREHIDEQVAEVEDGRAAGAQRLGEDVVLLLRPTDPRDAIEQQRIVVSGSQAGKLRSWAVEQHGVEPADLAVDVSVHTTQRIYWRPTCAVAGGGSPRFWPQVG